MNLVDIFILILLVISLATGWKKGFLKTITGPFSFIAGMMLAYYLYLNNYALTLVLFVFCLGPFLIKLVLSLILKVVVKITNAVEKPSTRSSVFGSFFNLLWSVGISASIIIAITLLPVKFDIQKRINKNIKSSKSYLVIDRISSKVFPLENLNVNALTEALQDPKKRAKIESSQEYVTLMENPKLIALMNDKKTVQQLEEKNISKLLQNPKVADVIRDPDVMKKLFALNKKASN